MGAPTDVDEEGSVERQQGLWPIQELRLSHGSDPFANLIFNIPRDLIQLLDVLGRLVLRIHPRRELVR